MTGSLSSVLADLPGWEDATGTQLEGGLSNRSWLLELDDRKAVLKFDECPRGDPFNTRASEAQIQTRAASAGLANAVLYASDTIYLTEYVEGIVWSAACLDVDENLDKLAAALIRLHVLPLTGRTFDAIRAATSYAERIDGDTQHVRHCVEKIAAMPLPHNLCCCHNDLVAANIIYSPQVCFLDWEYACDNDPFFDLATIVAHHRLPPERADYLLNAYFDGDGARWREHLACQAELYDALLWLWEASRSPAVA